MRGFRVILFSFVLLSATAVAAQDSHSPLTDLAESALAAGQHAEAASLARSAVQEAPAQARPYLLLGLALDGAQDYASAADAYRVAARLAPHDARLAKLLGRALRQSGDLDGAIAAFRLAEDVRRSQRNTIVASR